MATRGLVLALRAARDVVDREFAEPLDLGVLAARAGVSKYHFARSFEQTYGETPIGYLDNSGNWLVLVERRPYRTDDLGQG